LVSGDRILTNDKRSLSRLARVFLTIATTFPRRQLGQALRTKSLQNNGFVLAPVLWALSLLGLVAIILTKTVTLDVKVNANLLRRAEVEALADGMTRLVINYFTANPPGASSMGVLSLNGTPYFCEAAGKLVRVSALDVAGLIDLNTAPRDVLEALFVGLGQPQDQAVRLAGAIIDFRDDDDIPSSGGDSELQQYKNAGLSYGPKNAPFSTVGELDQVLGMNAALLSRLRPLVTVHSRMKGIDQNVASAQVLALPLPSSAVPRATQRTFIIRVTVLRRGNARFTREAIVEVSPRVAQGFLQREWSQADDRSSMSFDNADGVPSCTGVFAP